MNSHIAAGDGNGLLFCIALHTRMLYIPTLCNSIELCCSQKKEKRIHIFNFSSLARRFISFHFHSDFFYILFFSPPSSQICDFSKLQWKHSNPLQLRSRRSHLVYAFFFSFSFSFKNSTFHLTRNLALSTAATSRTNWKCFQNGILLSEFFFSFIHSLQPHLTLTSPFARVSNCLRV